jgi:hypothetical protein
MSETWGYAALGCAPWIVAWVFYVGYTRFFRAGEHERDQRRLTQARVLENRKRLESLKAELAQAERAVQEFCDAAERAAAQASGGEGDSARKAADRARESAEQAQAAWTAVEIIRGRIPKTEPSAVAGLAERAATAAASARAWAEPDRQAAAPPSA